MSAEDVWGTVAARERGLLPEQIEIGRLEAELRTTKNALALLLDAVEPFVQAAQVIAKCPDDYKERVVMIGGFSNSADLMKRHFEKLLKTVGN